MADADLREAPTRCEQIRVAVKHLRPFVDGERFTLQQIAILFGWFDSAMIVEQNK
jgi:hypothetical protein